MRALIVPRPAAAAEDHWYSFLAARVAAGAVPGLVGAEVRSPRADDEDQAGSLVLVGHEDGTILVERFLASLPHGRDAAGTLLVAPSGAGGDWHSAGRLRVLLSDLPGYEQAEHDWTERWRAEVAVRPGGQRFYGAHEVSVLINLAALATEIAELRSG